MALLIQEFAAKNWSCDGTDREALRKHRHRETPMFWRGFLHNGFCGCRQKCRLGECHRQQAHHDKASPRGGQGRQADQQATGREGHEAETETEGHTAFRQPAPHRPLQQHQKCELESDQGAAVTFAETLTFQAPSDEVQRQGALLQ